MQIGIWLNSSGIGLEIVGFLLVLIAVRKMQLKPSDFLSPVDHLDNVMSTTNPKINRIGISIVILGLIFQLCALFST